MKIILLLLIPLIMSLRNREVYIFYNASGVDLKNKQLAELDSDTPGLKERDIIVHTLNVQTANNEVSKWKIDTSDAFTFVLIGKDGGEKWRSKEVVTNQKLFAIIDAMPMRKAEMKKQ